MCTKEMKEQSGNWNRSSIPRAERGERDSSMSMATRDKRDKGTENIQLSLLTSGLPSRQKFL